MLDSGVVLGVIDPACWFRLKFQFRGKLERLDIPPFHNIMLFNNLTSPERSSSKKNNDDVELFPVVHPNSELFIVVVHHQIAFVNDNNIGAFVPINP